MMRADTQCGGDDRVDGLLGSRTVRELLECSDRTLRRWIDAGKFPRPDRRIGRSLRWRRSTVIRFIKGDS